MRFTKECRDRVAATSAEDEGFTLIELLVVLLIIGILLAIAIPTYLSIVKGANTTASQSNLTEALTGSDIYYTQNQSYNALTTGASGVSDISQLDIGLSFVSAASPGVHAVSVFVTDAGSAVVLVVYSPADKTCWGILDLKAIATGAIPGNFAGTSAVGTYYFAYNPSTATVSSCNASTATASAADISVNGFPKLP
ncbi:MAG TPA: prepilin-type N-terminal cleavage/methylation domain-containing protein [Acidimicrobiales bacterium]|jgi:type IV pilus assembly protein PilA|nr:prepilin-type N-terminal cleavage/methylation domain-containing protein [Acidimicrobiales bacterium]